MARVPGRAGARNRCTCCALQVYKAIRNGVQVVAVKIFTDQVAGVNQARYTEAFRREIFILRSCHDRNIVQFLGACLQVRQPVQWFIKMAFLMSWMPTTHLCKICGSHRMAHQSAIVLIEYLARYITRAQARGTWDGCHAALKQQPPRCASPTPPMQIWQGILMQNGTQTRALHLHSPYQSDRAPRLTLQGPVHDRVSSA